MADQHMVDFFWQIHKVEKFMAMADIRSIFISEDHLSEKNTCVCGRKTEAGKKEIPKPKKEEIKTENLSA
jgi:hypothetical protein